MSSKEKPSHLPGPMQVDEEAVLMDTYFYRESSHTHSSINMDTYM